MSTCKKLLMSCGKSQVQEVPPGVLRAMWVVKDGGWLRWFYVGG